MNTEQERAAVEADRQRRGEPVVWKPIETAPKDNKRLLYLARLDDQGKLVELDFDGVWEYWQESWELSHINGYCWMSANGIEEPTHWAYQDDPPPTTPQPAEPCVAPTLHNADSGAQNGIQATQPAESVADIHHWEWKHPVFTKGIWEKCCSLQMGIARAEYRKIAPQPDEPAKVPSDEELLKWAGEEQFFLFCDEDEFLQIAREVLSRYGSSQPIASAEPASAVNRETVIEWLDALDIEVTDKQLDGLFHAVPVAAPVAQEPVAKMVMPAYCSACGLLSAENMPCAYQDERRPGCLVSAPLAAPVAAQALSVVNQKLTTEPSAQDREDAERYRWLRDRNDWHAEPNLDEEDGTIWKLTFYTPAPIIDPSDDDNLDTALIAAMLADAARAAKEPS